MIQPDDPGTYARNCICCGRDEAIGPNRLCSRHLPAPAPWWVSLSPLRFLRWVERRYL